MIQIAVKIKKKIQIDFTFFIAISLFFYFDETGMGLMSIAACTLHELGHLLVLLIEKREFISLTFYGSGIKIKFDKNCVVSSALLLGGSLINIIIFCVLYYFTTSYDIKLFAVVNLIIGIFNLLPLKYFDGGILLEKYLTKIVPVNSVLAISRITSVITTFLLTATVLIVAVKGIFNLSVMIIIIYIIATEYNIKRM